MHQDPLAPIKSSVEPRQDEGQDTIFIQPVVSPPPVPNEVLVADDVGFFDPILILTEDPGEILADSGDCSSLQLSCLGSISIEPNWGVHILVRK